MQRRINGMAIFLFIILILALVLTIKWLIPNDQDYFESNYIKEYTEQTIEAEKLCRNKRMQFVTARNTGEWEAVCALKSPYRIHVFPITE